MAVTFELKGISNYKNHAYLFVQLRLDNKKLWNLTLLLRHLLENLHYRPILTSLVSCYLFEYQSRNELTVSKMLVFIHFPSPQIRTKHVNYRFFHTERIAKSIHPSIHPYPYPYPYLYLKKKWHIMGGYNPAKELTSCFLDHVSISLD